MVGLLSLVLTVVSGVCWTTAYVELIRLGFRDRTYGMPQIALALNIAWEGLYSYLGLIHDPGGMQTWINVVWCALDLIIVYTYLRFGREDFPRSVDPRYFWPWSGLIFLTAFAVQIAFQAVLGTSGGETYSAFIQNLAMSVLFISMLVHRRHTRGQSRTIAITNWLGTLAGRRDPRKRAGAGSGPLLLRVRPDLYPPAERRAQSRALRARPARPLPHADRLKSAIPAGANSTYCHLPARAVPWVRWSRCHTRGGVTLARVTGQIAASREPPRRRISLPEFMSDVRDEGPLTEWVNGEVTVHLPPTARHQDVAAFLFILVRHFVDFFGLGRAFIAPVGLLVTPAGPLRQPDIVVLTRANAARLHPGYVECPADLAVEVISPDSIQRDRIEKMAEYAPSGVREYWLVDPRAGCERADFYLLDDSGRYRPVPPDGEGVYRSAALPGFWLRTAWLHADPLPDAFTTFAEIAGLPAPAMEAMRRVRQMGPQV